MLVFRIAEDEYKPNLSDRRRYSIFIFSLFYNITKYLKILFILFITHYTTYYYLRETLFKNVLVLFI